MSSPLSTQLQPGLDEQPVLDEMQAQLRVVREERQMMEATLKELREQFDQIKQMYEQDRLKFAQQIQQILQKRGTPPGL